MFRYAGLLLRYGGLVGAAKLNGSPAVANVVGTGGGGASTKHWEVEKGPPLDVAVVYALRAVEVGEPTDAVEYARDRERAL